MKHTRHTAWIRGVEPVAVPMALLALWWFASHGEWVSRVFMPTPEATWESLLKGFSNEAGADAADLRVASW